ncbi:MULTISPECIES: DNA-binding protein [Halomonas]|uniref:HIRAN domain-containing protein n=1 Tax=Halomonas ventosae TaxID=229007 RepID=A0A4R6I5R7_9GAMM|nr:DNA-binding protein [Halomonas ventosae]TDO16647.1 hypothetical protein DFO68_101176 [Halomonas ventosae]
MEIGFQPLEAFPDLQRRYESNELFSVFRNRVPNAKRKDYPALVERLGLTITDADPFEILAVSGGARQTDNLEVFPWIEKQPDGSFRCRFFLHGWRYVSAPAQRAIERLRGGEELRVALELNNPATGLAIQLQEQDTYLMLGWAPRYLIPDLAHSMLTSPSMLEAHVAQVNLPPAPYNQRLLIEFTGSLPASVEPMTSTEYQPLVA